MDLTEAKRRLTDSGKTNTDPPAKLMAFRVNGEVGDGSGQLWATAIAPSGALAEAGQVAEWAEVFGPGVRSTYCTPLNGGTFVTVIVK